MKFKQWFLKEDIFGFEKIKNNNYQEKKEDEDPIIPFNLEEIMKDLSYIKNNDTLPFSNFINHIQWGKNNGSFQIGISPLGSFKAFIRRLQTDLEGNSVWICKKIIPYKDIMHSDVIKEKKLAFYLFDKIKELEENNLESPISDYKNLENLVVKIARDCQKEKNMPPTLIFTGIREIKRNINYIIHFESKGQGVEVPSQNRLEMFAIDISYDPKKGLIRSMGYEVQSPQKGHKWEIVPSDWDEVFSPAQSMSEISDCTCAALRGY